MAVPRRVIGVVAAGLALPYIASKIHFAVLGELGVPGGPRVTAADYARYGGVEEVSAAQWANVASGVLILAITVVALLPFSRRWNRWVLAVPLILAGTSMAGLGVYMIVNGAITGRGGYPFGVYAVVWGAAEWMVALSNRCDQGGSRSRMEDPSCGGADPASRGRHARGRSRTIVS
ncbi:hypothetical protein ACQHIV_03775 [Kribbella sp. GL6]|uniref:hypothetical protein n=1 Tax=Kribbella sp. GL6 TaxID=3419765 RepID=UPI003D01AD32